MATNNFKPFATGSSANVTTQNDYESLPALATGFQSGKASSAQINKALRQATFVASTLAQAISNILAVDVLDDGNQSKLVSQLISAMTRNSLAIIRQQRFTTSGPFTVPDGVTTLYLSGCGAGGGGGGSGGAVNNTSFGGGGGGGGAGQAVIRQAVSVTPGQTINITIGVGGTAGLANTSQAAAGSNGGNGGNTMFGSLLTLLGGGFGGGGGFGSNYAQGGAAGAGYPNGAAGNDGSVSYATATGGVGASGPYGGGGGGGKASRGRFVVDLSGAGFGSGGGGGGGIYPQGDTTGLAGNDGGKGAPGFAMIEW